MGGIKNKLSKLSNKVKTLFNSLPLAGEMPVAFRVGAHLASQKCDDKRADEMTKSSQSREGDNNKTIPLSDYRLTSPFSQRGTKNAVNKGSLSLKGAGSPLGLAEGSLSTGLSLTILTKYLGIACLSLAILSTLVLNIISSYSNSSTRSKAEPVGNVSTLANDSACDPANTNAASCISIFITSSSSSTSTGGDDANLSLSIPQGGGIATGRHTVEVSSNNVAGYYVMLTGNAGSPAMTPSATTSQAFIQSTTGTLANPTYLDKGQWGSWGIALPNSSLYTGFNTNEMDYNSTNQDVLTKTTWAAVPGKEAEDGSKTIIKTTTQSRQTDTYPVYYGVRVDNPVSVPADTYTAQVVYTATTNEVPVPTITNLSKNSYELGSGADSTVTIAGTNLASTYKVYVESNTDSNKQYDITSTITNLTDTGLTVTIPTDQTNPDLEPGDYTIHVVTQGGEETVGFSYSKSTINSSFAEYGDNGGHVQVDYDENMIPITYAGTTSSPKWVKAEPTNTNSNDNLNWFDYTQKKWANAVTVKKEVLGTYLNAPVGTEIKNDDVLGYWVYIPRYAYAVMRPNAADRVVEEQNFDIRFEAVEDVKKTPAPTCNILNPTSSQMWNGSPDGDAGPDSSSIKALDYRTQCGIPNEYPGNNKDLADSTIWATHPAFTWGNKEVNGLWVGKFETTGLDNTPTVLPNYHHIGYRGDNGGIGVYYSIAKSVGVNDLNNTGGSSQVATSDNYHNLKTFSSHMQKNSEYGAIAYLSASKFGAGLGKVQRNGNNNEYYDYDGNNRWAYGITGCGPLSDGSHDDYTTVGVLGTNNACGDTSHSYNSILGQLASTTGNWYGVYDMAGGGLEDMASFYTTLSGSTGKMEYFENPVGEPYVDLYSSADDGFGTRPLWSKDSNEFYYNVDACKWNSCGGHGIHEVTVHQSLSDLWDMWPSSERPWSTFVGNDDRCVVRGGRADGSTGVFMISEDGCETGFGDNGQHAFRVTLLPIALK